MGHLQKNEKVRNSNHSEGVNELIGAMQKDCFAAQGMVEMM